MSTVAPLHGGLGPQGTMSGVEWAAPGAARARATQLVTQHRDQRTEVARNPHLDHEWASLVVQAPKLLAAVQELIGPAVAVENTFLVIKWPGQTFEIPWHQDGIGRDTELNPDRSVAAWLALTDATPDNGTLHVIPGSHQGGYLPWEKEPETGAERGRANAVSTVTGAEHARALTVRAGHAVLMDMRLLHRSGSNQGEGARIALNVRYTAPDGIVRRAPSCPSPIPISGTGW